MEDLRLENENLTTRDIAYPTRPAAAFQAAVLEPTYTQEPAFAQRSEAQGSESPGILESAGPLFPDEELQTFRGRWDKVQTSFVDEPRQAVEQADSLVANVVQRIAEQFAAERERLEKQWDSGSDVSTEDLRQAMKRYRSFFDRLLTF